MSTKHQIYFIGILAIILMSLTAVVVPASAEREKKLGDKVAEVNGAIITALEFNRKVSQVQQQFSGQGRPLNQTQLSELKKGILENLIVQALLFQESQKIKIEVTDSDVDREMEKIKNR